MRSRRGRVAFAISAALAAGSCGRASLDTCPPEPEEISSAPPGAAVAPKPPAPSLKELGPGARRVNLVVLPSDAAVEIDGAPARRRDGVVEHVGRAGDRFRVRVSRGSWWTERELTIPSAPSPPLELTLSPPPIPRARPSDPLISPRPESSHSPLAPDDPLIPLDPDGP